MSEITTLMYSSTIPVYTLLTRFGIQHEKNATIAVYGYAYGRLAKFSIIYHNAEIHSEGTKAIF